MLTNSLLTDVKPIALFDGSPSRSWQERASGPAGGASHFRITRPERDHPARTPHDPSASANAIVEIYPPDGARRRTLSWDGMTADLIEATNHNRFEVRFRGPVHLLVVYEQGARREGDTSVDGVAPSALRDYARKFTFVPAGREYRERQDVRMPARIMYLYLNPSKLQALFDPSSSNMELAVKIFFEDPTLLDTALKLKRSLESPSVGNRPYLDALGAVLIHELVRLSRGASRIEPQLRGGLAAWQQRVVTTHIDDHLEEPISLSALAKLARLSPYYFCRAFKQSFGIPPHRYHINRRIERAKTLLAKRACSVTDIGLTVGYSETSSFTTAFRKATGFTPSVYRRSLG
jgi:AraC family transcriptional regulator